MTTLRRFKNRVTPDGDHLTESPDGDWIDYADHEQFVRDLLAQRDELAQALRDVSVWIIAPDTSDKSLQIMCQKVSTALAKVLL